MKCPHGLASSSSRTGLALLFGTLAWAACDHSNSVGKIGESGAGGSSPAGLDGGLSPAGGTTTSGVSGSAAGGTTAPASAGISGEVSGQAGASGSGKAGALGGSAVDAGVDRYQCPPTNIYCPDGYTTDAIGCTVCASPGTGGIAAGGSTAKGGAGGSRGDAAVDGHLCPPLTDVYCANYTVDEYGCTVCASSGTGGGAGGVTSKGGSGGVSTAGAGGGASGAAGTSGTGKACRRVTEQDAICRSINYPPLAYFCQVPAQPASAACVMYNGIDSGDYVCCPEQYPLCPDSPPTNGTACTGSSACTYGSHPDSTCRTTASCTNGTWQVRVPPSRCSEALLPATCPTSPTAGMACASHGLSCAYADGTYCTCSNCTVEDNLCNASTADTWRCWSPPGGDCPTYYPNLGTTCSPPANTSCRYTCASLTTCTAAGVWAAGPNRCPN